MNIYLMTIEAENVDYEIKVNSISIFKDDSGSYESAFNKINPLLNHGSNTVEVLIRDKQPKIGQAKLNLKITSGLKNDLPQNRVELLSWRISDEFYFSDTDIYKNALSYQFHNVNTFTPLWMSAQAIPMDRNLAFNKLTKLKQLLESGRIDEYISEFDLKFADIAKSLGVDSNSIKVDYKEFLYSLMVNNRVKVNDFTLEEVFVNPESNMRLSKISNRKGEPIFKILDNEESLFPLDISFSMIDNQWKITR